MFRFSRSLGIDLGTANVLVYSEGRGIVVREPSVVAMDRNTGKVLQVGADAKRMLGRTPGNVVAIRPLRDGVISDYEMTERMIYTFIRRVSRFGLVKPRVVVCVPSGITEVEERAVIQATMEAGARRVYLMEEPLAAALGAGMDITGANGGMVVDIGGGTTDIAVLSLGNIVTSASIKVAGDRFDEAIIRFLRRRFGVLVGQQTAEEIKITLGSVVPRPEEIEMAAKGRNLRTGLPLEVTVQASDIMEALLPAATEIVEEIRGVLEQTPPELVTDISQNGIVLTGGGSLIYGMDRLVTERTHIRCIVADDAECCVAYGLGKSLKWLNTMQEGTLNLARRKLMAE